MESLIEKFVQSTNTGFGRGHMFGNGEGTGWGAGPLNNGESHGFGQGLCGGNGREDGTCFGVGDGSGNGGPPLPHPWPPNFLYYGCGSGTGLIGLSNYKFNISIIESINGKKIYQLDFVPTIISSVFGNIAKGYIVEDNVYLRPCYVIKDNSGHFAHGKTIREAMAALEDKTHASTDM